MFCVGISLDECADNFAVLFICDGDHGGLQNPRVREEYILDFKRKNIFAACVSQNGLRAEVTPDDDIFNPSGDREISIFIHRAFISGQHP